jgi:hypothetical protein
MSNAHRIELILKLIDNCRITNISIENLGMQGINVKLEGPYFSLTYLTSDREEAYTIFNTATNKIEGML